MLYLLFSGKAGRIRLPDICVILICVWSTISLIAVHGLTPMIEWIGVTWIETLGAYLLGRCFIRSPDDFLGMARLLFAIGLFMLPFALHELETGQKVLLRIFQSLGPSHRANFMEGRLGFERVQGVFAHQIHFGVFFGVLVGLAFYVLGYRRSLLGRLVRSAVCIVLCFCSLATGALVAGMTQIYFLFWDGVLKSVKARWHILAGLFAAAYVVIDLISNRTPFHVFATYLAFNENTAYDRIRIWHFGTQSIWDNPLFGIGLNENWTRPYWMSASVDMFWIVPAMRHGVLTWALWLLLFFVIFFSVANRTGLSKRLKSYRMGYLCSMAGFFIAGWTVHYWDALYAYFMFFMASGIWMLDWEEGEISHSQSSSPKKYLSYSRFPPKTPNRLVAE